LNIERHIAHNALQLLVNQNDPTLFDNTEVFEKNLIENGASKSSELEALKQSLTLRLPWEIRKYGNNLNEQVIKDLAANFAEKSKVDAEISKWVVDTWIAVLGLKVANTQQTSNAISQNTSNGNINKNVALESKNIPQKSTTTVVKADEIETVPFDQVKGRLGIVFGEDSSGEVKVFNTWYKDSNSTESSLPVTPVKLESEPVKPFKTAPKRKKQDRVGLTKKIQSNTDTKSNEKATENTHVYLEKNIPQQEYKPTPLEQKAYDLLKKGSIFANEALKILAPIAVAGSVLACRKMGEVYYRGYGVVQNFQAAHAWLKLSAEKEDAESLFLMGTLYQFGMGVKQDTVQAKQFFERAARQGHTKSIESLKIISMGV
jgi:hypothetical protein